MNRCVFHVLLGFLLPPLHPPTKLVKDIEVKSINGEDVMSQARLVMLHGSWRPHGMSQGYPQIIHDYRWNKSIIVVHCKPAMFGNPWKSLKITYLQNPPYDPYGIHMSFSI